MRTNFMLYLLLIFPISVLSSLKLSRRSFPAGFIFGITSSAYQYEGAAMEDGKGPSIWDTFVKKYPDKILDHSNGNIATDSYRRYKEDVAKIKSLGFDAYRFSISWSRLLPNGRISRGINQQGIDYYNSVINELLLNGIQPYVTLNHWDLPQALEDEYGGFLSSKIENDFRDYAELCFNTYGDRVKHWITFNEPSVFIEHGFRLGIKAPGRCSHWLHNNCGGGDSRTEPYTVGHHQLLAHAAAVQVYKSKYQAHQKGHIGITLHCEWILPASESTEDHKAASRAIAFEFDWFMEPLYSGLYPKEMVKYVGKRMPKFSKEQSLMIKGSFDFIGLNYYTTKYATDVPCSASNVTDSCVNLTREIQGIPIGPKTGSDWLFIYPKGLEKLLTYTKIKFNNPIIYITENGVSDIESNSKSAVLNDQLRISYHTDHLSIIEKAIKKGANIKGYFAWSLLDNFEWNYGYSVRFGLFYIDYANGLKRYPKQSALWFKEFLHSVNNQTQLNRRDLLANYTF